MIDMGNASAGMTVAETLRRKRKITITTRPTVSIKVNFTSLTEARIDTDRSYRMLICTAAGICASSCGSSCLTLSTTSTVLVPGWRKMASTMERLPLNQLADLSSCTLSRARPISEMRTGAPLR